MTMVEQQLKHGNNGRPVELIANFFKFNISSITVFHYDIDIKKEEKDRSSASTSSKSGGSGSSPTENKSGSSSDSSSDTGSEEMNTNLDRFIKKFSPLVVQQFIVKNKNMFQLVRYVYDGFRNLYTVKPLDFDNKKKFVQKVQISVDGRSSDFVITLKLVEKVDSSQVIDYYKQLDLSVSDRAISVYEIFFRFLMGQKYELFQRKFFDISTSSTSPKVRLAEFVQGFSSSVRLTEFGLALNLHLKTSLMLAKDMRKLVEIASLVGNIK